MKAETNTLGHGGQSTGQYFAQKPGLVSSKATELGRNVLLHDRHAIQFLLSLLLVGFHVVFLEVGDIFWVCEVFFSRIW